MALLVVAGTGPTNVDLTGLGKGKRVASWHFSNVTAAAVLNLRNGAIGAAILIQIQLPVNASASQAYSQAGMPVFPAGVFVEIVTGSVTGSVDLV